MNQYRIRTLLVILITVFFSSCAHHFTVPEDSSTALYSVHDADRADQDFRPLFFVYEHQDRHNRIGQPSALYKKNAKESIYIDTETPVMYWMKQTFSTAKDSYTNHIYRIHFPSIPFSLFPFHLTAGNNSGLISAVTVNSMNQPVLITTVHTCGCYLSIIPTSYLSAEAFPKKWRNKPLNVYGETLPPILDYSKISDPILLIHIRPGVHRVMDLDVIAKNNLQSLNTVQYVDTLIAHMEDLNSIQINGKTTSFYYQDGPLRGHVKGSIKPWETLLLSLVSLDLFVGSDKAYADTNLTGNPFYTSLKPWNRNASNMWDFKKFLEFWGWKL